jgi:hypothetical protein
VRVSPMSVSGVTYATAVNSPAGLTTDKNQLPTPTKAETANANANATDAAQTANQIATERQASTRGKSQGINKLA